MVEGRGFEPLKAAPADLQSAPFDQTREPLRNINGGRNRARTCDPLLVRQVLSQLSYSPLFTINLSTFSILNGTPKGIRTPAAEMKTQYPRPLDDGGLFWLGWLDSNQRCRSQSPVPYRLATPH